MKNKKTILDQIDEVIYSIAGEDADFKSIETKEQSSNRDVVELYRNKFNKSQRSAVDHIFKELFSIPLSEMIEIYFAEQEEIDDLESEEEIKEEQSWHRTPLKAKKKNSFLDLLDGDEDAKEGLLLILKGIGSVKRILEDN